MLGKGNCDKITQEIMDRTKAKGCILIVLEGNEGHGFSVKATIDTMKKLPAILHYVADNIGDEIAKDIKQIEQTEGEQPNAKSTTEDGDAHSFSG
jgi:hypothetical protein